MTTYRITDYGVLPDSDALQTTAIQAVLDLCRSEGGRVVFPKGRYHIASLRLWSNTTLYLESGALLIGSDECDDYELYEVPPGVELRTDIELLTDYYPSPLPNYRRAMISAYGEKNIAILGEEGCFIEGSNCYDPHGEEGYRGPHGIFLTNCENIRLEGYAIGHSGNFMHQLDNCRRTAMTRVTCLGGSDGIHLHCCYHTLIEDCIFQTGDDCIAGIDVRDLTVRACELNTSCQVFRIAGNGIHVEDCRVYGPGIYPHRMTVVKGKNDELPQEAGRHNTLSLLLFFANPTFPCSPADDIVFRNCSVENVDHLIYYRAGDPLQTGTAWREVTMENLTVRDLTYPLLLRGVKELPLSVNLKNLSVTFRDGTFGLDRLLGDENTNIIFHI